LNPQATQRINRTHVRSRHNGRIAERLKLSNAEAECILDRLRIADGTRPERLIGG
jgi:hypothetical protein